MNVWAGLIGKILIEPYCLPESVSDYNYLETKNNLPARNASRRKMINHISIGRDGYSVHNGITVRDMAS